MRRTRALTLVEVLISLALVSIVIGLAYGFFHMMFWGQSRSSVTGLTRRSFIQKDAKAGLRHLIYRLREGIQILSPAPGATADELVFRDVMNSDVRLRRIPAENRVVSELQQSGAWVVETGPIMIDTDKGRVPAGWPVRVSNCTSIRFSVLAGDSVTIQAAIEWEGQVGTLLTVVKLRNAALAY